jgi:hypothetical protein
MILDRQAMLPTLADVGMTEDAGAGEFEGGPGDRRIDAHWADGRPGSG